MKNFRPRPVAPGTSSADQSAAKKVRPQKVGKPASQSNALTQGAASAMREMARRKAAYGGR